MYVLYELSVMGAFAFFFFFFLCVCGFFRVVIATPTIEVRFEHLNVEAEAHVGSRGLPTFLNFSVNIMEVTSYE